MIPTAYIHEWTAATPWPDPRQVEQDLIICLSYSARSAVTGSTRVARSAGM